MKTREVTSILLLLWSIFILSGCATNSFEEFYSPNIKALSYVNLTEVKYPHIDELVDIKEVQLWRNKGYEVIGESSFYGLWCPRTKAIDTARKHCAEVILVFYNLEEEKEEQSTIVVPQTTTTYHHGTIYAPGPNYSYSGYSTSVSYMPMSISYQNRYYTQKAFYLAKRKVSNEYGIYFVEPEIIPGDSKKIPVVVDVVIDDSPAAKAGIIHGDIVVSINGQLIDSFEAAKPFMLGEMKINTMEVRHE